MKAIFINSIQNANAESLKAIAQVIALAVRNGIEGFHSENLNDTQMKELNPLIRDAIYSILFAIAASEKNIQCAQYMDFHIRNIPPYWEEPKLSKDLQQFLKEFSEQKSITFKSAFLNQQFKIGNIFYNQISGCIQMLPSFDFKEVSGDKHAHRGRISALLRKEGYRYHYALMGYNEPSSI